MSDLFRTRAAQNQLFKTMEGAHRRAAFENAHNDRWHYTVLAAGPLPEHDGKVYRLHRFAKSKRA